MKDIFAFPDSLFEDVPFMHIPPRDPGLAALRNSLLELSDAMKQLAKALKH